MGIIMWICVTRATAPWAHQVQLSSGSGTVLTLAGFATPLHKILVLYKWEHAATRAQLVHSEDGSSGHLVPFCVTVPNFYLLSLVSKLISQNHRSMELGRDFWRSYSPSPC